MQQTLKKSKLCLCLLSAMLMFTLLPTALSAAETEYNATDAVAFVFTNSGITTTDTTHTSDYKIEGTDLSIKAAGTYLLSGSCGDGSVTVKKGTTDVILVLNGLNLTNAGTATSASAPLVCNKSTGVTIIAATGTTNALADSIYNNDETYTTNEDAENAVIKCKDGSQVTITGGGKLTVTANGKNGIKSGTTDSETVPETPRAASLTIEKLELTVTANNNDAINAEQELNILSGTLNLKANDDAIHCDYALAIGKTGTTGPTVKITKATEGIEGATVTVSSGDISILTTDDCINAANSDLTDYDFAITVTGGKIYGYTTTGDGFDSNGTLTISGGTVEIWSANTADNQPLDADGAINITGGTVFAAGGSNGMGTKLNATQTYITFGSSGNSQPGTQQGNQQQPGTPPGNQQQGQQEQQQNQQNPGTPPDNQQQQSGFGNMINITKGDTVTITDSNEATIFTAAAPCNASYVFFSSPDLDSSETYTLNSGENSSTQDGDENSDNNNNNNNNNNSQTFTDVSKGAYYEAAVNWAVANGITYGTTTTTFSPENTCTRNQVVTFLWRAAGSPEPTITTSPFTDVTDKDAYYYKAVLWAVEKGITNGETTTVFGVNNRCTRGQVVTFLYRYAEEPTVTTTENPFTDVTTDDYYYTAVLWAVNNGVTNGTSTTTFSPDTQCKRCEIVTFLYRDLANK